MLRLRKQVALLQGQLTAATEKVESSGSDLESLEARMQVRYLQLVGDLGSAAQLGRVSTA